MNKQQNKYHNQKTALNGLNFDSRKEAIRYSQLKLLQRAGEIKGLEWQKKFELIPAQYRIVKGKRKCVERACNYYADFYYFDTRENEWIVEDVKGMKTNVYKLKKKLMLYVHNIIIKEI